MAITITVMQPKQLSIQYIRLVLPVNYGDEDMPEEYPFRNGDEWNVTVNVETGAIQDARFGGDMTLDLAMKVCDGGSYYLLDENKEEVAKLEEGYVPSCIPGDTGDYVEFEINSDGVITNWDADEFEKNVGADFFKVDAE